MSNDFAGHDGRECGEHRTTGLRAWCHDCSTWCYPEQPCPLCERPVMVAHIAGLEALLRDIRPDYTWPDDGPEEHPLHRVHRLAVLDCIDKLVTPEKAGSHE